MPDRKLTPEKRLERMRKSFDKDKSVLAEDYAFFTGPKAATPGAPNPPSRAGRTSGARSERRSPRRS
jgi:hypothetical protein